MHTVEVLERLKEVAENAGYTVRQEWLGGAGGGACQFAGRKWIFIDLSLTVIEQLDQVAGALRDDPTAGALDAPLPIQRYLDRPLRRAA
jgi:hypothetical protein